MKLNLLPATVSRGRATKSAWVLSIVFGLLAIGASIAMVMTSSKALADAKAAHADALIPAQATVAMAAKGDEYMRDPKVQALVRNVSLAQAMIQHNDKYPALYNDTLRWVPPFFRITSLSATPMGDQQAVVSMTGTLATFQQYADLMLALMRNPRALSVTRSGFVPNAPYVPNLVEVDQTGRLRLPNQQPIPDDPLERLTYFESQGATTGFDGVGNFGSGDNATRLAMPNQSLVTVSVVVTAPIMTPNPRASMAVKSAPAATTPAPGAPAAGGRPQ